MKKLFNQIVQFIGISGIGWLIDFAIFNVLTLKLTQVSVCNMISSLVAVCFVFSVATRKTFVQSEKGVSLKVKFGIYVLYQILLIILISKALAWVYSGLMILLAQTVFIGLAAVMAKIFVTPITMLLNFCAMKFLIERI